MEGESSSLETQTPVFMKKKAKHSKHKDRHRQPSQESFRAAPVANEQCGITKRKKKRKNSQHLVSSPLKKSEICDETEMAISKPKKKKKRRKSALGVDRETGVAYVLVDKENIENTPKNFRSDVDVVYVDRSKEQKSTKRPKADDPRSVTKPRGNTSEELHGEVRKKKKKKKKHKKRQREVESWDAVQESPGASNTLPRAASQEQEPQPQVDQEGGTVQLSVSAGHSKSRKRKRKHPDPPEFESLAAPKRAECVYSEGSRVADEVETAGGSQDSSGLKKKSKKRKQRSLGSTVVPGDFSVPGRGSEDTPLDSLEGTLIEESAKPRPQEENPQACSRKVQR